MWLALWSSQVIRAQSATEKKAERPNVIFIVADDLGYGEPGCYGGTVPTPNIDGLAKRGARFDSGYVTSPVCAPSRAALMTGRYGTRHGFEFLPIGVKNEEEGVGLALTERTVADELREVGYATSLVGKWHLGGTPPMHPQQRGFDEFFGFVNEGHYYVPVPWDGVTTWLRRKALPDGGNGRWTSPDGRVILTTHLHQNEPAYDSNNPLLRSSQPVDESENLTDAFTREACHFIHRHQAQPFFLYLAYNAVHSPMQASDAYLAKFASIKDIHRRIFAAMLAQLDDGVGKVMETLRSCHLEENTLVVFLSDNGGPTDELTSSNAPLRGFKGEMWEGGLRVPFVLSWPGRIAGARVIDVPVISMDATATALEVAGVGPTKNKLDGVSLIPLLTAGQPAALHDDLFWRMGKKHALREGSWKIIRDQGAAWQLYDLASDKSEAHDVAPQHLEKVQEMESTWERWSAEQAPPAFGGPARKAK